MNYTIKERSWKKIILTQGEKELGSLDYIGWSSAKCEINLHNGEKFSIDPKSFWKSSFELKQNGKTLLEYAMNFGGTFAFKSSVNDPDVAFTMKSKGFWGKSYVILDKKGDQMAQIMLGYSWKTFKSQYDIQTVPAFDALPLRDVLVLSMVHGIRYFTAMAAAAV
ncbi:hypothetical protein [Flavobacterium humi]|uniref:Uncharacterized protein n=1 Tax=Flavobacterium humi TaxID=2562683 RepID=A0A4Z0LBA9_9FLAO|nr:hypothetical protein [Flavobacterium humi]TGD59118.1 hypothetical protein E4635_04505 [Flavobacterium humi]